MYGVTTEENKLYPAIVKMHYLQYYIHNSVMVIVGEKVSSKGDYQNKVYSIRLVM